MGKIYTKKGDEGMTKNFKGEEFSKSDTYTCVVGEIDELQSSIQFCKILNKGDQKLYGQLERIYLDLWRLAGEIAKYSEGDIDRLRVEQLERNIDDYCRAPPEKFEQFRKMNACWLNEARVRARRLERTLVKFDFEERLENRKILAYVNRLSDYFFAAAWSKENES